MSKINKIDDFMDLVESRDPDNILFDEKPVIKKKDPPKIEPTSIYHFIQNVSKIVSLTMDDIDFSPDEGARLAEDVEVEIKRPMIKFKIISRTTAKELTPRHRETILVDNPLEDNHKMPAEVYGQTFNCIIQFDIYGRNYKEADDVLSEFEENIIKYNYFLIKNGVSRIYFDEQLTDKDYDVYRQHFSIRSIRYRVVIEKTYVRIDKVIDSYDTGHNI